VVVSVFNLPATEHGPNTESCVGIIVGAPVGGTTTEFLSNVTTLSYVCVELAGCLINVLRWVNLNETLAPTGSGGLTSITNDVDVGYDNDKVYVVGCCGCDIVTVSVCVNPLLSFITTV
jgi:hypothetical protein